MFGFRIKRCEKEKKSRLTLKCFALAHLLSLALLLFHFSVSWFGFRCDNKFNLLNFRLRNDEVRGRRRGGFLLLLFRGGEEEETEKAKRKTSTRDFTIRGDVLFFVFSFMTCSYLSFSSVVEF
jgi:hypothetical protein